MCIPSSCHGSGTPVMTRIHHLMGLSPLVVGATQQWSNFGVTSPSVVSILSSHLSQELTVFVMATLMWNQPIVAELFYALKNTRAHIYREPAIAADELVLVCVYLVTRLQYALHGVIDSFVGLLWGRACRSGAGQELERILKTRLNTTQFIH